MSVQEQVPSVGTSHGPAWTASGNNTVLAWKGESDTKILWSTTSKLDPDSGSGQYNWGPEQVIPNVSTSTCPALASFKGDVYLAWKGAGPDVSINLSRLGTNGVWTPPQPVPGVGGTSDAPALAALGDTLYLAWKGQPGDERIFWSTSSDGKTWSPQQLVPGAGGTSAGPALAGSVLGGVYLAWKAETGDPRVFWSKSLDGKTWSSQSPVPGAATSLGPTLAADAGGNLNLAWAADNGSILFSALPIPTVNTLWSPPTVRFGVATNDRPVLLGFTPQGPGPLMLAWKGRTAAGIWYGPMNLPAEAYTFDVPIFHISMMRTGHATLKDGSDTDYVCMSVKVRGRPISTVTKFVGDQTGGNVNVGLGVPNVMVSDTDNVYFHYSIINSGGGPSAATAFLENAASKLLGALETADEIAIKQLTGVDLSGMTPQEAGALVGGQLGNILLPGLGAELGALAGWFAGSIEGFVFPDCDGPVAIGIFVFSGAQLRNMTRSGVYVETDENPGVTSASGCGQNSDYQVTWNVANVSAGV